MKKEHKIRNMFAEIYLFKKRLFTIDLSVNKGFEQIWMCSAGVFRPKSIGLKPHLNACAFLFVRKCRYVVFGHQYGLVKTLSKSMDRFDAIEYWGQTLTIIIFTVIISMLLTFYTWS